MNRRGRRRNRGLAAKNVRVHGVPAAPRPVRVPLGSANRKALLLGTALASTLLLATVTAPAPAAGASCPQDPSPTPINFNTVVPITCINTEPRSNGAAIRLTTTAVGSSIFLDNSGVLSGTNLAGDAFGVFSFTTFAQSPITVVNSGDISVTGSGPVLGVNALYVTTGAANSPISITNSGKLTTTAQFFRVAYIRRPGILDRRSRSTTMATSRRCPQAGTPTGCKPLPLAKAATSPSAMQATCG